jgi:hypothetical protein
MTTRAPAGRTARMWSSGRARAGVAASANARLRCAALLSAALLVARPAQAAFTETLPEGVAMADVAYSYAWLRQAYDNDGNLGPLIDPIWRYEPGGGLQGVITPNVDVRYQFIIPQLQLGILKNWTVGVALPITIKTTVDPTLDWQPGDYQQALGRPYSDDDFWQWAASMGQPKPGKWEGNHWTPSDTVLGTRLRWTDYVEALDKAGIESAATVMYAIRTGKPADPEEIVAAGTTMWDLHAQGELALHLGVEKSFKRSLDDRLRVGVDGFYECFFQRTLDTPRGTKHPLLLNYAPYVGDTYRVDPGDFAGFSVDVAVVPVKGPEVGNWITKGDAVKARELPPLLTVSVRYTYTHLEQSRWYSESDLWDWDREKLWRPGYKNIITARVAVGLLRLGVPAQVYATYRTLTLLPGKNTRAANVLTAGVQVPIPLW